MRHRKAGRKFGRERGLRRAFLKTLINNFLLKERIVTTAARAKEIRSMVEALVTTAKRHPGFNGYRLLLKKGLSRTAASKLHKDIAARFVSRPGGYVRIVKTGSHRVRDGAETVIMEFVK